MRGPDTAGEDERLGATNPLPRLVAGCELDGDSHDSRITGRGRRHTTVHESSEAASTTDG
jgi:hypothetical protein